MTPALVLPIALALASPSPRVAMQDSAMVAALASHANAFDLEAGSLRGPGADSLARIARENQFLLVGETPHGVRELPAFVAALYDAARPAGYRHLCVEAGPISTRMLEGLVRGPGPRLRVTSFLARHTAFSLPFFNWSEEVDLIAHVVATTPGTSVLEGLDQEFLLSSTQHLERLTQLAHTPLARALAQRDAVNSAEGNRRMTAENNPTALWMLSAPDDSLARLTAAFATPHSAEADTILRELAESRAIYHLYFAQKIYESNRLRTDLMKRHFMSWFYAARAAGEASPRAVIKLGANHVFRGPSGTDTYEIGSFVPELATALGGKSFSMLVLVAHGTVNAYRPFGSAPADTAQRYDATTDADVSFTDIRTILAAARSPHWTLIDLRPVRADLQDGKLPAPSAEMRRTLLSFDAIVVVPEGHASHLLIAP
jgi:erythromycin esterase-like protein